MKQRNTGPTPTEREMLIRALDNGSRLSGRVDFCSISMAMDLCRKGYITFPSVNAYLSSKGLEIARLLKEMKRK